MKVCKEEGCGQPTAGRGMCKSHYMKWRARNPGVTVMRTTEQTVLKAMPGTPRQLMERTGICRPALTRALGALNYAGEKRQAYIYDYQPPITQGAKWLPIWRAGNGHNKQLTEERKQEHARTRARMSDAKRRPPKSRQAGRQTTWLSALGVPP